MKAIIFDLGGVLIDLDMHQCFENIRALGVDLDAISKATDNSEQGATICEGITASGMMHLYQVGKVSTDDFIGLMARLSADSSTPSAVARRMDARECLFLDDSKVNCEAAEKLGINCIDVPVRTDFREEVRQYLKKI